MSGLVSVLNRAVVQLLPFVPRPLVWRVSRRYIAGTTLEDAFTRIESLNAKGMSATMDVLGEDSTDPEEARRSRDIYLAALDGITERGLDCNISIKLSQMGLSFDAELCLSITRELAEAAEARDNFLRIDMEDSSVTAITLDIYRELRKQHTAVGTVVQSYLRRTEADVQSLLAEGPTNLRVCKGIYREPADLAFQEREEVRDSYRQLLEMLFAGGAGRVGIATHDPILVDAAKKILVRDAIPKERYEFQMLLGVAERLRDELVSEGHPLRVYVPFGEEWFAYSARRLRENPEIAGHVIRNLFRRR